MRSLAVLLLTLLPAAVRGQDAPPKIVLEAAACLATSKQDWLGLAQNPPQLELGYESDTKSVHGATLLYLVSYKDVAHSAGSVFTFLVPDKDPHHVLRLQAVDPFRESTDGTQQVQLINPPLGGIWTQEQIIQAIQKIGFLTVTVPVTDIRQAAGSAQCEYELPSP